MAKILVVDDDKLICWSMREIISQMGHQVDSAANIEAARELVSHSEYDLIFIDMEIEEENGVTLTKELRLQLPEIPIVILSAWNKERMEAQTSQLGIFALMEKPFESSKIREIVNLALNHSTLSL